MRYTKRSHGLPEVSASLSGAMATLISTWTLLLLLGTCAVRSAADVLAPAIIVATPENEATVTKVVGLYMQALATHLQRTQIFGSNFQLKRHKGRRQVGGNARREAHTIGGRIPQSLSLPSLCEPFFCSRQRLSLIVSVSTNSILHC